MAVTEYQKILEMVDQDKLQNIDPYELAQLIEYGDYCSISGEYNDPTEVEFGWAISWMCSYTEVGIRVYTYLGVPVAIGVMECRKCENEVYWLSVDAAQEVTKYFLNNFIKHEQEFTTIHSLEKGILERCKNLQLDSKYGYG